MLEFKKYEDRERRMQMMSNIKHYWDYVQSFFDIDGDCVMALFTAAIVWKILHRGLNPSDAAAYGSAVAVFGYSNVNKK